MAMVNGFYAFFESTVVDVSQMRGKPALILSSLILQKIFDHNQLEFTEAQPETIPTIAVVEEAQSVLGSSGSSGDGPYVSWVKEGRKYDLGAVLITQQPGSISSEILSQGDNWFIFHLLSSGDLKALKKANAHFSDNLLSTLLNEPIIGHGTFWSSADGKSYPIPIRILSFEALYKAIDPQYNLPAAKTFAQELKARFKAAVSASRSSILTTQMKAVSGEETQASSNEPIDEAVDVMDTYISSAIDTFRNDITSIERIKRDGMTWRGIVAILENALPEFIDQRERNRVAFNFARKALNEVFGEGAWDTEKRSKVGGSGLVTWVVIKNKNEKSIEQF
ncbi:MAG: hypothetical protein SCH70_11350 [Candidatus Methanoperedens sp.]|nr:hypothetical protein [Candidatus Methanoperedens sp.]